MTIALETYHDLDTSLNGDEALEIIDAHRKAVDEHFSVEQPEREFPTLSRQLGGSGVYVARAEDNLVGAFKWRGAFAGAYKLAEEGYETLVVPSAGNHARGAIVAARTLGLSVHVVVPTSAPPVKKELLGELWKGGKLSIHTVGQTFDESLEWAKAHPDDGVLLHPYDDPNVARGQGTIVDDILTHRPDTQHIVVPVGGGGLLAGTLHRLTEQNRTDIHVHAVEALGSNSLSRSLRLEKNTQADTPNPRFGGSAVRYTGQEAYYEASLYSRLHLLSVDNATVDDLINDYQQDRVELLRQATPNLEPTSLVAVAGLSQIIKAYPNEVITVVGTGKNEVLRPLPSVRPYRVPM